MAFGGCDGENGGGRALRHYHGPAAGTGDGAVGLLASKEVMKALNNSIFRALLIVVCFQTRSKFIKKVIIEAPQCYDNIITQM